MKLERLIGILAVLLQEKHVTAPQLAQKFEVSRRTINRDIVALAQAGIPLYTTQGVGGGIQIMDDYRLDRTALTTRNMQSILTGLRSLDSVSGSHHYRQLMEKLQSGSSDFVSGRDYMLIDLASWYKRTLVPKMASLQAAIEGHHPLTFNYTSQHGDSVKVVEPYYLVFKWSSWYLWAWRKSDQAWRLYKVNRMGQPTAATTTFTPRPVLDPTTVLTHITTNTVQVRALFTAAVKWRVVEEFGPEQVTLQADGRWLLVGGYSDLEHLIQWLLTFGAQAEVLEPVAARQALYQQAQALMALYRPTD